MRNPANDRVPTEHLAHGAGVIVLSTETLVVLLAAWRMQPRQLPPRSRLPSKPLTAPKISPSADSPQ
jgi:hypothetical protein